MGTWKHAGFSLLHMTGDEQQLTTRKKEEGKRHILSKILQPNCSHGTRTLLLPCVPTAPRSSAGEVNPSPDDGQDLPDFQLRGRAGFTSTHRSFVGLWPQLSDYQTEVRDGGRGESVGDLPLRRNDNKLKITAQALLREVDRGEMCGICMNFVTLLSCQCFLKDSPCILPWLVYVSTFSLLFTSAWWRTVSANNRNIWFHIFNNLNHWIHLKLTFFRSVFRTYRCSFKP